MATITGNSRGWGALAHTDHHSSSRLTKSIQPGPASPSRSLAVPSIGSPVRADECTRAIIISAPGLQLTRGPTSSKSDGPSRLRMPLLRPRGAGGSVGTCTRTHLAGPAFPPIRTPGGPVVSPDLATGHDRYGRGMTRLPLSVVAGRKAPNTPSPGRNGPHAPTTVSPLGSTQTALDRPHNQRAGHDHCLGILAFNHRAAAVPSACLGFRRGYQTRASVPRANGPIDSASKLTRGLRPWRRGGRNPGVDEDGAGEPGVRGLHIRSLHHPELSATSASATR